MRLRYKIVALLIALFLITTALSGCWDHRELNEWFVLTGMGMDAADNDDEMEFTFQVANIQQGQSGSGSSGGQSKGEEVLTFNFIDKSLARSITQLNRDNDKKLLFQHNQIRLFGTELAQRGIKEQLDLLLRDYQARLEVPMAVAEGKAKDVLKLKLPHEPNSGIFLGQLFKDLSELSDKYVVRLIDLVHMFLDGTIAPVMPILKITTTENDEVGIMFDGMAVFKEDKMIGKLNNEETLGYILSCGDTKKLNINIQAPEGKALLHIYNLKCEKDITVDEDKHAVVTLKINAKFNLNELQGFKNFKPDQLIKYLEKLAQEKISELLFAALKTSKELKADVFGFCTMASNKYVKRWDELKDDWEDIYVNLEMLVETTTRISSTGQISSSLEMEENLHGH